MPFAKLRRPEELWEKRLKGVQGSPEPISVNELKKIAKQHEEEFIDDPWWDEFLRLIAEQPQSSFYRETPQEEVVVYYCRDADFGVWVVPGSGSGPLDQTGKRLVKEAIQGPLSGPKIGGKK